MRCVRPVFKAATTLNETPLSAARRRRLSAGSPCLARSTLTLASKTRNLQEIDTGNPPKEDNVGALVASPLAAISLACLLWNSNTIEWKAVTALAPIARRPEMIYTYLLEVTS